MAEQEHDREDIMREASGLPRRVELEFAGSLTVVAGFRHRARFSVYVDQDPVYHFDADGRLRRAYVGGFLYRSHGDFLAQLSRRRSAEVSELVRTDVGGDDLHRFLGQMRDCCRRLHTAITADDMHVVAQVPSDDGALVGDVAQALERAAGLPASQALAAAINTGRH